MTNLERKALARVPLTRGEVETAYLTSSQWNYPMSKIIADLCESHERLRMELAGAEELIFGGGEKDDRP